MIAVYSVGVHAPAAPRARRAGGDHRRRGSITWVVVVVATSGANYGDWASHAGLGVRSLGRRPRYSRPQRPNPRARAAHTGARGRAGRASPRGRRRRARADCPGTARRRGPQHQRHGGAGSGGEPGDAGRRAGRENALSPRSNPSDRETIDEMRRMLGILRRSDDELALAPQPSLRDLDALVEQVEAAGLDVNVRIEGTPRSPAGRARPLRLPDRAGGAHERAQARGAGPRRSRHSLPGRCRRPRRRQTTVQPHAAGPGTGNGLVGMRERAALFGGELRAGVRVEGGWALHATLPLAAP